MPARADSTRPFRTASRWHRGVRWWLVGGREVSDAALRAWCRANLPAPLNRVTEVRQHHLDAYAEAHR